MITPIDSTLKGKVLITGGAGTLGKAIVRRGLSEKWGCEFTVLSRDPVKHQKMRQEYPNVRYILGDILDENLVYIFAGHDIVIHAAAQKHIPESEANVEDCILRNLDGSRNVADAALVAGVKQVVGISTDKAAHPVNPYGACKYLMEKIFQEKSRLGLTEFHLVRYGNVLASTGSVVNVWREMLARDGYVTATDAKMTRFWLTADDAVNLILLSLQEPSGTVTIPKCKALDMATFAKYVMPGVEFRYSGLRAGEKRFEELITIEEALFVSDCSVAMPFSKPTGDNFRMYPTTRQAPMMGVMPSQTIRENGYRSDNCEQLTQEELLRMLA